MDAIVFTPTDFVGVLNQTLEFAYPIVTIEGELSGFRVSKNRWVYFDLKDDISSVPFFGSVFQLPGPLQDGLTVRVVGSPRYHPKFGFTISFQSITPVGEGSLKKAADLLLRKLTVEGLFEDSRKRTLPDLPENIGLITAAGSAAAADFIKILNERWGGLNVWLSDVYVQGEQAAGQIIAAINHFNQLPDPPEVLVITRGGGSEQDLAAFNDERVVRAVASSRIPTLVAIGHEVDISLAEMAADKRASTPTNAAMILVPDRAHKIAQLQTTLSCVVRRIEGIAQEQTNLLKTQAEAIAASTNNLFNKNREYLQSAHRLAGVYDPSAVLRRGYALVRSQGKHIASIKLVKANDLLVINLSDGTIKAKVIGVNNAKS